MARQKTPRQMLDEIDEYLAVGDAYSQQLWDVLCALRGPDQPRDEQKDVTTAPIRSAAFPRTYDAFDGAMVLPAAFRPVEAFDPTALRGGHFSSHIRFAAEVLGLLS